MHNCHIKINNIDVIYFDQEDPFKAAEKKLEELMPEQPWPVKNQARMNLKNNHLSYISSFDGVSHFTKTPTAIAAQLHHQEIKIMTPYGLEDLFQDIVKPTQYYLKDRKLHTIYILFILN